MAVIHRAYTFDPKKFDFTLREKAYINHQLDRERLLNLARTVVSTAPESVNNTLEALRFDADWLEPSECIYRVHQWYLIALSQWLSPSPSLSRPDLGSYGVLRVILPLAGWDTLDVKKLITGLPLHTLPEYLDHDLDNIRGALDQYGGWLSLAEVEALEIRLRSSKEHFLTSATQSKNELTNADRAVSASYPISVEERLERAYADGINMLREAMGKRQAIFLILD